MIPAPGTDATVWSIPTVADETLDNDRQDKAKENAEQGLFRNRTKAINASVPTRGSTPLVNQVQTNKQDAEADADIADGIGALGLNEHQQHNADDQGDSASVSVSNSHSSQLPSD